MPSAREALLDAAYTALLARPWTAIRMVEVAAAAGVSRQTLYNEFGGKDGLARALVRRETENYLAGVERALAAGGPGAAGGDAAARVAAAAAWTVRTARANPLVRAALTGCWDDRLPAGRTGPAELVGRLCERAVAALAPGRPREELPALGAACETAVRLTLSWVIAPAVPEPAPERPPGRGAPAVPRQRGPREPEAEAVSRLVRGVFAGLAAGAGDGPGPGGVSAPNRTAGDRSPRR
ncbi:TetR/AcrR family transcriptional regulator [Streptomyces sp. RS10V-4]|uniref:TetR/AcrR family transcriptional regulator n=1 Tax=Streptomyces rhizoryzae TaxID=2932493 RepID=UPI0020065DB6|nr:TetR/AcrR family transcriptional regulator [Streptomyces rhizoryzae]MCK7624055.1 TetR/AcrR family transcriptional regulator [Streptomyces rhizoryzae]